MKDSGIGARGEPGVTWTLCSGARTTLRTRVEGDECRFGPSDYYPKYESKYFRFKSKPKYVKIL